MIAFIFISEGYSIFPAENNHDDIESCNSYGEHFKNNNDAECINAQQIHIKEEVIDDLMVFSQDHSNGIKFKIFFNQNFL